MPLLSSSSSNNPKMLRSSASSISSSGDSIDSIHSSSYNPANNTTTRSTTEALLSGSNKKKMMDSNSSSNQYNNINNNEYTPKTKQRRKGFFLGGHPQHIHRQLLIVVLVLIVVLTIIYKIFSGFVNSQGSQSLTTVTPKLRGDHDYVVIIDAGSSGSRAHVFRHSNGIVDPEHESLKVKPGLSSYATNHEGAGKSLEGLFEFARKHIPSSKVSKTPVYLKATAGMRLLDEKQQNAIMDNVRNYIRHKSGFTFEEDHWAQIIPGEEEGLLGWMSVNYLNESPGNWGVMELGGASIQVTMKIDDVATTGKVPKRHERTYHLPEKIQSKPGKVYTHSFLGLGMESARTAVNQLLEEKGKEGGSSNGIKDPCLQKGYKHNADDGEDDVFAGRGVASGNYDECKAIIKKALFKDNKLECEYDKCLFNGLFAPNFIGQNFWAFENFYYTPSAIAVPGVPGQTTISNFQDYAKQVCNMDWSTLDSQYPKDWQPKDINNKWCFGSTYIYLLLTKGLQFEPTQQITVSNNVGNNGIDWALGAAIKAITNPQ